MIVFFNGARLKSKVGGRFRDVGADLYDIRRGTAAFGSWSAPSGGLWANSARLG